MDTTISIDIIINRYSTKPSIENKLKAMIFCQFQRNMEIKSVKNQWSCKLMDNATKKGIDSSKAASKRVVKT